MDISRISTFVIHIRRLLPIQSLSCYLDRVNIEWTNKKCVIIDFHSFSLYLLLWKIYRRPLIFPCAERSISVLRILHFDGAAAILDFHDGVRNLERALKPPHLSAVGICARLWLCSLIKLTQQQFDVCSTYAKGSGLLLHDSETIELRKDLLNYIIKQREYRVRKLLYFWLTWSRDDRFCFIRQKVEHLNSGPWVLLERLISI